MKGLGINFGEMAVKAGGLTAGAVVAGKISNMSFMTKFTNPTTKGLVMAAIGFIGIPMIAHKAGLAKGKKGGFIEAVGEGVGLVGLLTAGHNVQPALIPGVAGIEGICGYEQNPIQGLGALYDTDGMSGTDDGMYGTDDDGVSGYEKDPTGVYGNDDAVYGMDDE